MKTLTQAVITAVSLLVSDATNLEHLHLEIFLHFFGEPVRLCQDKWVSITSLYHYFQIPPEIFSQVQVLTGSLKDFDRSHSNIVILEGELSP